jgi:hypothetical protein
MSAETLKVIPMPSNLLTERARNVQPNTIVPVPPGSRITGMTIDAYRIDGDVAYLYVIG